MSVAAELELPAAALSAEGPQVVLGGSDPIAPDIRPAPGSLFGPRSAFLAGADGPLLIADTGHHRVVVHSCLPDQDGREADIVLGQPDFFTEGRNALRDEPTAETMNVPTGICRFGEGVAVADSWNNRVLIWRNMPERSSQPADIVLGQADFEHQRPNRDGEPRADTMHWPFQVMVHDGRLYVCDAGNRRVLVWRELPTETSQPADFALGQTSLDTRSDNGGKSADERSLRWPHDMTVHQGKLFVSDAGNNRVLAWDELPNENNTPASLVLGQADYAGTDHNRGIYLPTAEAFSMPYALNSGGDRLLVADTANSRLLGFSGSLHSGQAADMLTAQPDFRSKGDNRNKLPVRDSICWPYGLHVVGRLAVVSDTGNHRILLWGLADAV